LWTWSTYSATTLHPRRVPSCSLLSLALRLVRQQVAHRTRTDPYTRWAATYRPGAPTTERRRRRRTSACRRAATANRYSRAASSSRTCFASRQGDLQTNTTLMPSYSGEEPKGCPRSRNGRPSVVLSRPGRGESPENGSEQSAWNLCLPPPFAHQQLPDGRSPMRLLSLACIATVTGISECSSRPATNYDISDYGVPTPSRRPRTASGRSP
jgi:hypothetical protein